MINQYLDWTALNKIRSLLIETIPETKTDDITQDTVLEDICFDAFGLDLLRPKLEETFNILVPDAVLNSFKTVGDIVCYVRKYSKKL